MSPRSHRRKNASLERAVGTTPPSASERRPRRVLIVGAGPIGVDAALAGVRAGFDVRLLERGRVGEHLRRWGHVTLFSPWHMNLSRRMVEALEQTGARPRWDPEALHTGAEYVARVLEPLADHPSLRRRILTGATVLGISRSGALKDDFIGDSRRAGTPFEILYRDASERERTVLADVVVDAGGIFSRPNHLGSGGLPVPGELGLERWIERGLPDVAGSARRLYAGKHTLLVGDGLSAATTALGFRALMAGFPARPAGRAGLTRLTWVVRSTALPPFSPAADDPLPQRARLMALTNEFVTSPPAGLRYLPGARIESLAREGSRIFVVTLLDADGRRRRVRVDRVVSNIGFSPDNSLYRELQVHECYATFGPMKLSAAILAGAASAGRAGGGGDCLAQTTHGIATLQHPEPDFFVLGAKSYGRNSSFLMRVGFDQVSEVFDHLAARR